jgi:murein DD-endopeptidase MepM/ murein hydrolase activator NlpD
MACRRTVRWLVVLPVLTAVGCGADLGAGPTTPPPGATPGAATAAVPPSGVTVPAYRPPVVAPVLDGFRPPAGPFAAGNRGIEYETAPGSTVGAIGAGRVVFAGPVAGALHATVHHGDGLRSSYSYLASITVAVGDRVEVGQPVGTATDRLHLGVRAGEGYLDPADLFGGHGVRLVPVS